MFRFKSRIVEEPHCFCLNTIKNVKCCERGIVNNTQIWVVFEIHTRCTDWLSHRSHRFLGSRSGYDSYMFIPPKVTIISGAIEGVFVLFDLDIHNNRINSIWFVVGDGEHLKNAKCDFGESREEKNFNEQLQLYIF